MGIPQNIIEDIKYRNDIEDVIGSYVTLKRAGSNVKGLCPFHNEKTPSFTVYPNSQSFYCFGCGAAGDAITFIMRMENLDYVSAIEFLAKRCGITIPENDNGLNTGVKRSRVLEMNIDAAKFYRSMLLDENIGRQAREYLLNRGFSMAVIKRFGLGYSPNQFGLLRDHLASKGYTQEEMTQGFLCGISKKNGAAYDYFRGRVMFPVIDVSGNVVAFGGRVLDDSKPKYLNTSDTPAFKKSKTLFALNYAKSCCADQMILCEGYMDVIALHAAGFGNAVATLGTAITPEHARIMKKHTKLVVIAYDSDTAGKGAVEKAIKLFSEVGLDARVLKMNAAKDPDEYIKKFGKERFARLLGESRTMFDHRVEEVLAKYDINLLDEKIKAANELCAYISTIYSEVEKEVYISQVSEKLGIPAASIKNDIAAIIRKKQKAEKSERMDNIQREMMGTGDRINPDLAKYPKAAALEEIVLGLIMIFNEYIPLGEKIGLKNSDFVTEFNRRVYEAVCEAYNEYEKFDISMTGEKFTPDEISRITRMRIRREQLTYNGEDVFRDNVDNLKKEAESIKLSESGDIDDIMNLINRKKNL